MQRYFSPSTLGVYAEGLNSFRPEDAVQISDQQFIDVFVNRPADKLVAAGANGVPMLVDQPAPAPLTREQVEAKRLRAYADPLTGSDRYFAEAQRESLLGNVEAADAAKTLGMARFAEIQAELPWPAE